MEGSVRADGHPCWDRRAGLVVCCSGVELLYNFVKEINVIGFSRIGLTCLVMEMQMFNSIVD